jgi:hypothetical protein
LLWLDASRLKVGESGERSRHSHRKIVKSKIPNKSRPGRAETPVDYLAFAVEGAETKDYLAQLRCHDTRRRQSNFEFGEPFEL